MTAKEFFIEQFNKCVWIEDGERPGNIFMVYDKYHKRKIKTNSILNKKKDIPFIKTGDTISMFYQDYKNGYLSCNYDEVWSVLEKEYSLNFKEITALIIDILNDDTKLNQLKPMNLYIHLNLRLNDDTKLNQLKPNVCLKRMKNILNDDTKLMSYE